MFTCIRCLPLVIALGTLSCSFTKQQREGLSNRSHQNQQSIHNSRLQQLINEESKEKSANFPKKLAQDLKQRQVVFVDGFLNELSKVAGNYFTDNIAALKKLGLSSTHLNYSSTKSVATNADLLYKDVVKTSRMSSKKLILIGHSKGGAELLYMLLRHPELIWSGKVERVILIQASIGGSPLANNIKQNFVLSKIKKQFAGGLDSLRPEISQQLFTQAFSFLEQKIKKDFANAHEQQSAFESLSQRIFYVRSVHSAGENQLSGGLKLMLHFCEENDSGFLHDGLVPVENQILKVQPPFGVDLGVLHADHMELVISGLISRSNAVIRQAFTRALLRAVYEKSC